VNIFPILISAVRTSTLDARKTAFELTRPILANENFWILGVAAPLVLFWILGGVIFWTVRWIRRGFTNAK
jgi:hypothetical protein